MKTTLDLPDALATELQRRAAADGQTPEQLAAHLLAAELSPQAGAHGSAPTGTIVPKHLPLIKARPAVPSDVKQMSAQAAADWIKDVDLQLEVERYEKSLGHRHVDRADH
jgi:hypothetical protein